MTGAYPEHDRMMAVSEQSQALGDFLVWLQEQGIELARWEHEKPCDNAEGPVVDLHHPPYESGRKWRCEGGRMVGHPESNKPGQHGGECEQCSGTGTVERIEPRLVPTGDRIETLLARRFDIDLDAIEAEKRQMLDAMRAQAAERFTIAIDGKQVEVPDGAAAWRRRQVGVTGGYWVYDHDNARRIESEDPDLIVWAH